MVGDGIVYSLGVHDGRRNISAAALGVGYPYRRCRETHRVSYLGFIFISFSISCRIRVSYISANTAGYPLLLHYHRPCAATNKRLFKKAKEEREGQGEKTPERVG